MTAYGRGALDFEGVHVVVEIQSVNRRHLEMQVHLPRMFGVLETEVRRRVSEEVLRGQILVRVQLVFHGNAPCKFFPNLPLAREMKRAWDEVGEALGEKGFHWEALMDAPDILVAELDEVELERLKKGLDQALTMALRELVAMKEKEGKALTQDFLPRLAMIEAQLEAIKKKAVGAPERWRTKLRERIEEVIKLPENDDRLLKEIALMVERSDITEECVRVRLHVEHFREALKSKGAVGKTLEFILQELGREINTLGSKSQDGDISRCVIEVKSELEKIREQVQNVE